MGNVIRFPGLKRLRGAVADLLQPRRDLSQHRGRSLASALSDERVQRAADVAPDVLRRGADQADD